MDLNAQWVVGFTDGEGCFHIGINKNKSMKLGVQVLPEYTVVQHERNIQVLHAIKDYFGCGVVRRNHGDRFSYRVRGHKHLTENIMPFFEKHQLKTSKSVDFKKFRKVLLLMEQDEHLTVDGLERIREIKNTMNPSTRT
jgi:hypothetical protein